MAMNVQGLQGQWNQLKGEVKKRWGQCRGRPRVGRRQHRPARRPDPAADRRKPRGDREVPRSADRQGGSVVSSAVEAVGSYAQEVSHRLRDHYGQISQQAQEGYVRPGRTSAATPCPGSPSPSASASDRHLAGGGLQQSSSFAEVSSIRSRSDHHAWSLQTSPWKPGPAGAPPDVEHLVTFLSEPSNAELTARPAFSIDRPCAVALASNLLWSSAILTRPRCSTPRK